MCKENPANDKEDPAWAPPPGVPLQCEGRSGSPLALGPGPCLLVSAFLS